MLVPTGPGLINIHRQKKATWLPRAILLDVIHVCRRLFSHVALQMTQGCVACLAALEKETSPCPRLQREIHARADRYDLAIYMFYVVSMLEHRPQRGYPTNR